MNLNTDFASLTDNEIVKAKADIDQEIQFLRQQKLQYQAEEDRRANEYAQMRLAKAAAEQGFTLVPTPQSIDVVDIPSEAEVHG